jgi:Coenzyme PQQ synthesis protein D (PqqD)
MSAYRVPERLAHVVGPTPSGGGDPTVFLVRLPDGLPVVLRGSAAMIWVLAADGEDDVAAAVGALVGMSREDVADAVDRFLDDLLERGLLEAGAPGGQETGSPVQHYDA